MRTWLAVFVVASVPFAVVGCGSGSKNASGSGGSAGSGSAGTTGTAGSSGSTAGSGGGAAGSRGSGVGGGAGVSGGGTGGRGDSGGTGGTGGGGGTLGAGGDGPGGAGFPPGGLGCPEPGVLLTRIPVPNGNEEIGGLAIAGGQVFYAVSASSEPVTGTLYSIPTAGGSAPVPFATGTGIYEVAVDATDVFWIERDQCCSRDTNSTIWKKPITTGSAVALERGIVRAVTLALTTSEVIYAHGAGGTGGAGGGTGGSGGANGGSAGRSGGTGGANVVTDMYVISRVSKAATAPGTSANVVTVPTPNIPIQLAVGQNAVFYGDDEQLASVPLPGPASAPTLAQLDPAGQTIMSIASSGADVFGSTSWGIFKRAQAGGAVTTVRSLGVAGARDITIRSLLIDGSTMFWLENDANDPEFPASLMRGSTDGSGSVALAQRFNASGLVTVAQDATSVYLVNLTVNDGYALCKIPKT